MKLLVTLIVFFSFTEQVAVSAVHHDNPGVMGVDSAVHHENPGVMGIGSAVHHDDGGVIGIQPPVWSEGDATEGSVGIQAPTG